MSLYADAIDRAKQFLGRRRYAYRMVFGLENVFSEEVLADLAHFCRANRSTGSPDSHVAARLDGRREVWLRIAHHINLTDEQLWTLYGGDKS